MSISAEDPGPMRPKDCLLYLFGNADAARRIAHSQAALFTGLLLVLTAAIARRYDALYLPASWTWWAGPIIISILSSLLVFVFVRRILRLRNVPSKLGQYASFLGLFWMTAPCAWLYAIPFEAHLDSLAAAQANLALVALVAFWRVAILTRAMQAITGAPFSLSLIAILFPAALEAAALAFLAPLSSANSALAAMGGIRLVDPGEVFLQRAHVVVFQTALVLLIVLGMAHVLLRKRPYDSLPFPAPSDGRVFSSPSFVALGALCVWIAVSIPSQTRQRLFHHAETLKENRDSIGLTAYLETLPPDVLRPLLSKLCSPLRTLRLYEEPSDLLTLRPNHGTVVPINHPILWEARRKLILFGMEQAMGPLPERYHLPPFDPEIVESVDLEHSKRHTLRLTVEHGDRITVYLYLPNESDAATSPGRLPAVLALHPTNPVGKGVVDGQSEEPNRAYGRELAERGYIVLAPDYPSFGDSQNYDFNADAYVSGTMKGLFNHIRCVDYLVTRPDVDPDRIGVIGHSLGGHNAIFAAGFDERLKVTVSSCGWDPFHFYYEGDLTGWSSDRYMPRIRDEYGLDPNQMPFDFYGCIAAIAPRGFFSNSPIGDENFTVEGVRKAEPVIAKVYDLFNARDRFQIRYPVAGHDFPPEVREESYRFIDSIIGPPGE